ncbi:MAG: porin family protein [Chitinophagaceae bacterium]
MPESEFDKQIQRELEGLRLRPSATVWENVEKELRQKKRRRIIIAFWLIAGIALLGSTTYFLTRKDDQILAETSVPAGKTNGSAEQSTTAAGGQTPAPGDGAGEKASSTTELIQSPARDTESNKNVRSKNENLTENTRVNRNISTAKDEINKNSAVRVKPSAVSQQDELSVTAAATNKKAGFRKRQTSAESIDPAIATGKTKRAAKASENNTVVSQRQEGEGTAINSSADTVAKGKDTQEDITETTPVVTAAPPSKDSTADLVKDEHSVGVPVNTPPKKADKKIKWSLDLAVGGSGPVSRPFLVGDNHADMAYDNVQYMPVQGGGLWQPVTPPVNAFGPVYSPRSDIKPGLSYRAGVLFELPLSKRVAFTSGLQYQYQSNNIRIGSYVNTQLIFNNFASQQVRANGVYQGVQMKTFTNRYHYVQIPLLFNWQLNKGNKMPVILNTGFSAGYLVSTNALTYDTLQGGTYYHDRNAFKRFQFSFTTGVSFRFGNHRSMQWSIGPEASMGLRKMVKTEYDTRQYPLYIGVQGRIYLPRNK